jgi:hypothetical protein
MKYVYVLASSEKDVYYEQFFLSATSFRLYNPSAELVLLVDSHTKSGLVGKRSGYEQLVSEITVVEPPVDLTQKEISRWLKTAIPQYVSGDFLYIDCDTIITTKLNYSFSPDVKIGSVLDCHVKISENPLQHHFEREDQRLGFQSSFKTGARYNGGLLFYHDTPEARKFFEKWHSLWLESRKKGITQDMPALNQANYEMNNIITELGGEWNCQISHNGIIFLHKAKVIHYFGTTNDVFETPYLPGTKAVLSSIKETGIISNSVIQLLENPLEAFNSHSRLIADENMVAVFNSSFFSISLWLCRKHYGLFKKLNAMLFSLSVLVKKIIKNPVPKS